MPNRHKLLLDISNLSRAHGKYGVWMYILPCTPYSVRSTPVDNLLESTPSSDRMHIHKSTRRLRRRSIEYSVHPEYMLDTLSRLASGSLSTSVGDGNICTYACICLSFEDRNACPLGWVFRSSALFELESTDKHSHVRLIQSVTNKTTSPAPPSDTSTPYGSLASRTMNTKDSSSSRTYTCRTACGGKTFRFSRRLRFLAT